MKVTKLYQYMKARAEFEGVQWDLDEGFLDDAFGDGCREFFGVKLDNNGKLLSDRRQPAFFKKFHSN